jgi:predicted metal-dependent hydrolase
MTIAANWNDTHRFWNETPFRSYLFNAFSLLLPSGEQFIIETVEASAQSTSCSAALQKEAMRFVREEKAHQRAHRVYNQRLAAQGYDVAALEERIAHALQKFQRTLSPAECLCLTAAFEYLTTLVSLQALQKTTWLSREQSAQSSLWQWHCAEEIAHHHVALDLLAARRVGYGIRVGLYLMASLVLLSDIARHIASFYRSDRQAGRVTRGAFWKSAAAFVLTNGVSLLQLGGGWLRYFQALPTPRTAKAAPPLNVRFLRPQDIAQLMALERKKWNQEQAASVNDIYQRMAAHPQLCIGAFSTETGEALASLFMKPITFEQLLEARTWADCAKPHGAAAARPSQALFGISLSSTDSAAVEALFEFFWPYALKGGWRHIYLGSPVPGLARWQQANPKQPAHAYVFATRHGQPRDPQLRYYWGKGFKHIMACKPNYFPHEASLDYGAVIRGRIPLSALAPVWKRLPLPWLQGFRRLLFLVL